MPRRPTDRHDLLPGTLDMLVLKVLSQAPMHGYGIAQQIQRLSQDALKVEEGSLYPALQRIRQQGWITAEWKQTPNNQRARYYTITAAGRRHLGAELVRFADLLGILGGVLGLT
jgi:transcriptional regulator